MCHLDLVPWLCQTNGTDTVCQACTQTRNETDKRRTGKQTCRQIGKEAGTQTKRQADRQTDRQRNRQTDIQRYRQTDR